MRRMPISIPTALWVLVFATAVGTSVYAQPMRPAPEGLKVETGRPSILDRVGVDQRLGAQVPLDLPFADETGATVRVGDYLHARPAILVLVYYGCPNLCTAVLNELQRVLQPMTLSAGTDFDIITVSFDPNEKPPLAAQKKAEYLKGYKRPAAAKGWHFLTGSEASIHALTEAVGFRYAWDAANQQYIHSGGLIVLTPQGKVSRYFYGIDYAPRDLRLSLMEASGNQIGTPTERVLLYCFKFDPRTGKYSVIISRVMQVAAVLTVLTLGTFLFVNFRRDRRQPTLAGIGGSASGRESDSEN